MKNYLIYALIGIVVVGGVIVIKNKTKPKPLLQNQTNQTSQPSQEKTEQKEKEINSKVVSLFEGKLYNLCQLFPKEKIEEFSGRPIVNTEFKPHKELSFNQYLCRYYQEEAKYGEVSKVNIAKHIAIGVIEGEKQIKRAQEGYKMLKYTTKQDKDIPFNHLLVYDEKGKLHHLDLLLTENYKLTIETWWSLLSNDEALQFVKKFTLYLKDLVQGSQSSSSSQNSSPTKAAAASNQTVPLPQDEDILKNFVTQIEEGRADNAAKMMKTKNETEMQMWGVQFAAITSFKLLKMEKANEGEWTDTKHIYKLTLDVKMDPRSADAPIPYYGWQDGENIRWITLEKVGDLWKIAEIATGP